MSYYRTCPRCGAHLDPGEACDCDRIRIMVKLWRLNEKRLDWFTGQMKRMGYAKTQ